jgi:type II secretory pathway pseudopilin PulG
MINRQRLQRHHAGFSLLELGLALSVMGLISATLTPLISQWREERRYVEEKKYVQESLEALEAFALSHVRLPCPATDAEGQENLSNLIGICTADRGHLPWRTLGIKRPPKIAQYAVATLATLGAPAAHILTTRAAIKQIPLDVLSSMVLIGPESSGNTQAALPALQICEQTPNNIDPMNPVCPQGRHLSISAVAIVALNNTNEQFTSQPNGARSFIQDPNPAMTHRLNWITYEKLMWLYVRAGIKGLYE